MGKKSDGKIKYYHASPHKFKPGDIVNPIRATGVKNYTHCAMAVFLTSEPFPHYTLLPDKMGDDWDVYQVIPFKKPTHIGTWDDWVCESHCEVVKKIGPMYGLAVPSHLSKKKKKRIKECIESEKEFLLQSEKRLEELSNAAETPEVIEDKENYTDQIKKSKYRLKYLPDTLKYSIVRKTYGFHGLPSKTIRFYKPEIAQEASTELLLIRRKGLKRKLNQLNNRKVSIPVQRIADWEEELNIINQVLKERNID